MPQPLARVCMEERHQWPVVLGSPALALVRVFDSRSALARTQERGACDPCTSRTREYGFSPIRNATDATRTTGDRLIAGSAAHALLAAQRRDRIDARGAMRREPRGKRG